jgi:hypothetical protein
VRTRAAAIKKAFGLSLFSEDIETEAGKQHDHVTHKQGGIFSRVQLRKKGETIIYKEDEFTFLNNVPMGLR